MSDLVTRRELVELLRADGHTDLHPQTIFKWEQAGMPVAKRGGKGRSSLYSEAEVRAWLAAREEQARNGGHLDPVQQRARKDLAQAMLAEQQLALNAEKLLRREDVEKARAAEIAGVRSKILAWPMTIAPMLHREATLHGQAGVEQLLRHAVEDLLRDLAGVETIGVEASPKTKAAKKAGRRTTTSKKKTGAKKRRGRK